MARPRKVVSIDEAIAKQEEVVAKLRERYDTNVQKLKDLYKKKDAEKKRALLDAVEKSTRSYEEIMEFLTVDDEK